MPISKESKEKVKSSEVSGMETDQPEHLDLLLNQSVKALKNMILKRQMFLPFLNQTISPLHPLTGKILM